MTQKKNKPDSPSKNKTIFHEELEGFDLKVNTFGEMESTFSIDRLNDFLDNRIADKKFKTTPTEGK